MRYNKEILSPHQIKGKFAFFLLKYLRLGLFVQGVSFFTVNYFEMSPKNFVPKQKVLGFNLHECWRKYFLFWFWVFVFILQIRCVSKKNTSWNSDELQKEGWKKFSQLSLLLCSKINAKSEKDLTLCFFAQLNLSSLTKWKFIKQTTVFSAKHFFN